MSDVTDDDRRRPDVRLATADTKQAKRFLRLIAPKTDVFTPRKSIFL